MKLKANTSKYESEGIVVRAYNRKYSLSNIDKFDAVLKMHIIKNSPLFSVAIMALVVDTVARTWIAIFFLKAIQELAVLAIQVTDLLQQLMF